jgi:flagellar motor switch protein FliN/FliY
MPHLDALLEAWTREFGQALQMMTGESYRTSQHAPAPAPDSGLLWWQQEFTVAPGAALAVGADIHVWNEVGTRVLQGAGIELVEQSEARNTWFEIIGQATSGAARALGRNGLELECGAGGQIPVPAAGSSFELRTFTPDGVELEVAVHITEPLVAVLSQGAANEATQPAAAPNASGRTTAEVVHRPATSFASPAMDALLDVELPVSISFGQSALPLKDVLKLTTGSVVELNRQPEEPVDIIVNDHVIARGEVVVVEGNYAVRIHEIVSRRQRLGLCEGAPGEGGSR